MSVELRPIADRKAGLNVSSKMEALSAEQDSLEQKGSLSQALDDVDATIARLMEARNTMVTGPQSASATLVKLQNPVKQSFADINSDLKEIYKTLGNFSKAVDRKFKDKSLSSYEPHKSITTNPKLINRAVAMHLLREGHFSVADAFLEDVAQQSNDPTGDVDMMNPTCSLGDVLNLPSADSETIQEQFQDMYEILDHLRQKDLGPAVEWAQLNSEALNRRGSDLEFELAKLHFTSTMRGEAPRSGLSTESSPQVAATTFARQNLARFQHRYLHECQQLMTSLIFSSNLSCSPYRHYFPTSSHHHDSDFNDSDLWTDVCTLFVREFCSLLSLSASPPLLLALTAGSIALPLLLKLQSITKSKRASWTTPHELPVEIPLPGSYRFHSIFVCPISKEQTTDTNPPMMMTCGHVIAMESLNQHSKDRKVKCMYCPKESHQRDARKIVF